MSILPATPREWTLGGLVRSSQTRTIFMNKQMACSQADMLIMCHSCVRASAEESLSPYPQPSDMALDRNLRRCACKRGLALCSGYAGLLIDPSLASAV